MTLGEIDQKPVKSPITDILDTLVYSTSLKIALFGALLTLLGVILQTGIWAALLVVWGSTMLLLGIMIYTIIWWTYQ